VSLYEASLENINSMTAGEDKAAVAAQRKLHEKQVKMGYTLLDQLSNLQDQVIPEIQNDHLKSTLERIAAIENEIENQVRARPVGEGLTEEAMRFERVKREGTTKDE